MKEEEEGYYERPDLRPGIRDYGEADRVIIEAHPSNLLESRKRGDEFFSRRQYTNLKISASCLLHCGALVAFSSFSKDHPPTNLLLLLLLTGKRADVLEIGFEPHLA